MAAGPWNRRVGFSTGGSAFVPGVVVVEADEGAVERARGLLEERFEVEVYPPEPVIAGWYRISGDFESQAAADYLLDNGITAQVVHVFFSHSVQGSPLYGSPLYGSPLYGSPLYGSPLYGSPLYGSPLYGSPMPSPSAAPLIRLDGSRRSSARPETPTGRLKPPAVPAAERPHVAILDTGWIANAHTLLAGMPPPDVVDMSNVPGVAMPLPREDVADGDGDGFLDPVTGHATFIAGIVEQYSPLSRITIMPVLTEYGDGREDDIAVALDHLAKLPTKDRPHVVNLSFGGYLFDPPGRSSLGGIGLLSSAIRSLQSTGTVIVASAGNDGSFAPTYPAALDGVVGVGAVDAGGGPAPFTNYGDWVRACALGVGVVSIFFDGFVISDHEFHDIHPRRFQGWASWSGSSFAAPRVTAALARAVRDRLAANEPLPIDPGGARGLVDDVLGPDDARSRLPMLGSLVTLD